MSSDLTIYQSYVGDLYCSDDYMLYLEYVYTDEGYEMDFELIYVNGEDGTLYEHYTYDGYRWVVYSYDASYGYIWADIKYSLLMSMNTMIPQVTLNIKNQELLSMVHPMMSMILTFGQIIPTMNILALLVLIGLHA